MLKKETFPKGSSGKRSVTMVTAYIYIGPLKGVFFQSQNLKNAKIGQSTRFTDLLLFDKKLKSGYWLLDDHVYNTRA